MSTASPPLPVDSDEEVIDAVDDDIREYHPVPEPPRGKCFWWQMRCLCCLVTLLCLILGPSLIADASEARLEGWRLSECVVQYRFPHDNLTNMCIYLSVQEIGSSDNLCAVPAELARGSSFRDPPACRQLDKVDKHALQRWASKKGDRVTCYLPANESVIPATQCAAVATADDLSGALWRAWLGRVVYLVEDHADAIQAFKIATAPEMYAGIGLTVAGSLLIFFTIMYWLCLHTVQECHIGPEYRENGKIDLGKKI